MGNIGLLSRHGSSVAKAFVVNYASTIMSTGVRILTAEVVIGARTGEGRQACDLVTRITVILLIFNFDTWFFAQIVENREKQLSIPFLGPGDIFSKSYDENQIWSKWSGRGSAARGSDARISGAIQLPYKSVFVITFRKNVPRT
jgi:hypothetical protein